MFSCSAPTWRSKVQIPDSSCFQKHSAPPPGNLCSSLFYVFFISQVRPTAFISNSNLSCVRLRSCLCVFAGVEVRQSCELRGKNLFKDLGRRQSDVSAEPDPQKQKDIGDSSSEDEGPTSYQQNHEEQLKPSRTRNVDQPLKDTRTWTDRWVSGSDPHMSTFFALCWPRALDTHTMTLPPPVSIIFCRNRRTSKR